MIYAIAIQGKNGEEYMREERGEDCFTDDIGHAITYEDKSDVPELGNLEYIVMVDDDGEGGLYVAGRLLE